MACRCPHGSAQLASPQPRWCHARVIAVPACRSALAAVHARSAGTKAASPCTGAAVVAPHASSQLAAVREVRSCCSPREISPRPRCEPAPPLASRRFAACSMLLCARRSSPLAPASGSRGWRPSHRVALRRRAHSDGDGDDATVTEVNGGAQLPVAIT